MAEGLAIRSMTHKSNFQEAGFVLRASRPRTGRASGSQRKERMPHVRFGWVWQWQPLAQMKANRPCLAQPAIAKTVDTICFCWLVMVMGCA
jgi:hypothetical protein